MGEEGKKGMGTGGKRTSKQKWLAAGLFVRDKSGSTGPSLVHMAIVWRGRSVHVQDALWAAKTDEGVFDATGLWGYCANAFMEISSP